MAGNHVQIERILCPTDFSEFSNRALEHAIALTRRFEARLHLLHVVPSPGSPNGGGYLPATREMLHQAGIELRRCAGLAVQDGVAVVTMLREGEPWREILGAAEHLATDLVVMGTHGRAGFDYLLLGSVAEKVLRRTPCPVLTVGLGSQPPQPSGLFDRILCASDLSESSAATLAFGLSLAEEQQSKLTLLHVLEGVHFFERTPELASLGGQMERVAWGQLTAAVPPAVREWCTVNELVTFGRAHHEILRVAAEIEADVIVMGTRGRGAVGRMLFGSTSQRVMRAARCPVLTVRPERKARSPWAQASPAGAQVLQVEA